MRKIEKEKYPTDTNRKETQEGPKRKRKDENWKEIGGSGGAWSQWEEGRQKHQSPQILGTLSSSLLLQFARHFSLSPPLSSSRLTSHLSSKPSQIIHSIISNPMLFRRLLERLTHGNLAKPTTWTFTSPSPKPKKLACRVNSTAKTLALSSCANLKTFGCEFWVRQYTSGGGGRERTYH